MHRVEGRTDLRRDPNSKAIINIDEKSYESVRQMRENRKKERLKMQTLESEVSEMKDILGKILNKLEKDDG